MMLLIFDYNSITLGCVSKLVLADNNLIDK